MRRARARDYFAKRAVGRRLGGNPVKLGGDPRVAAEPRQSSRRFCEDDLRQIFRVLRAGNAPEQPMHAILIRRIKRAEPIRVAGRSDAHIQTLE